MGQNTNGTSSTTNDNSPMEWSESINIDDKINFPILAVGDSITKGYYCGGRKFHPYAIRLTKLLEREQTKVYEFGYSGETTEKMKNRLKRLVDKRPSTEDELVHYIENYDNAPSSPMHMPNTPYRGAIIIGGTNDLAYSFSSDQIASNLIEMYEYCFSKGVEWVVTCSIPSSQYDGKGSSDAIQKVLEKKARVNQLIKDYVTKESLSKKILFVDFMTELNFTKCSFEEQNQYWDDALHFTPIGSDRIADILYQHITQSGFIYE